VIDLAPDVFVADAVQAYGAIRVGAGSSLWPNAVLRAECQQIRIGRMSNIQDFVMVHVGYDAPSVIGDFCSIAHHATIHGATIGHDVLVGIGAVVMDGARIGDGSIVAGGAVVAEGAEFPAASILAGTPARVLKTRDCSHANRLNAWLYHRNADAYRQGHHRAWCGEDFDRWKAAKWAQIQADRDLDEFPRG
jgi:carbonic anhydrase/acetyltransferase-like protein (isoleucine patch superfamily)